jgi:hypothetical protein
MKTAVLERSLTLPQQDIVLVGSSLSYHLKEWYFTQGDVRNASIPGGSPLTGLAIIAAAPSARPRAIVVETNVLNRGIGLMGNCSHSTGRRSAIRECFRRSAHLLPSTRAPGMTR